MIEDELPHLMAARDEGRCSWERGTFISVTSDNCVYLIFLWAIEEKRATGIDQQNQRTVLRKGIGRPKLEKARLSISNLVPKW